jgi:hypothetical protein
MCFGLYKDGCQLGFARVITDKATFAYLCDVFVVQTIIEYPELQGLKRWLLATADAHSLYNQFGFTPINSPERWMGIYTPYEKE